MSCIELVNKAEGSVFIHAHLHDSEKILFVRSGNVKVQIDQHIFQVDEPSIILIRRLENHTFISNSDAYSRYYVIIKSSEIISQMKDSALLLSPFINCLNSSYHVIPVTSIAPTLETLFSLLYDEFKLGSAPNAQLSILHVVLRVLYRHLPNAFPYDAHPLNSVIQRIQQRFEDNPADEISLAALATEYHFSVSYLTHCFKEITGYSIGKYRMLCRIAAAKQMLLTTNLPISTISNDCGFADLSNFCRYFRKEVGCSPSSFRTTEGHI